jgi:hypothetical protein
MNNIGKEWEDYITFWVGIIIGVLIVLLCSCNVHLYVHHVDETACDTIHVTDTLHSENDIDLLFKSVDTYRDYLGAERQDEILIHRLK